MDVAMKRCMGTSYSDPCRCGRMGTKGVDRINSTVGREETTFAQTRESRDKLEENTA
jgi:hypothetical protein